MGTYSGFWIFRILARAAIYGDIFDRTDMAPPPLSAGFTADGGGIFLFSIFGKNLKTVIGNRLKLAYAN